MSKLQLLNEFFMQRLTVAAVEIFGAVQEVMVEYQDEISRSKEENERLQRILDLVLKPEIKLHKADPEQTTNSVSEEVPHELQEWSPGLRQEDIEIKQIKKEQEFDTPDWTYTPWDVENDSHDKNPTMSLLEDSERNDLSTTPAEQNNIEPDEEGYAASEPTRDLQLHSAVNPDSSGAQSKNVYRCDVCNISYRAKGRLTLHMRLHTETPYHCTFCLKRFKREGTLKDHVSTHTGERPYPCHICEKTFKKRNHLLDHIKTHTGERPHSCHVCGKCFPQSNHLTDHIRIHTGERPFSCPVCGKDFTTNSTMVKHIRTHTGEKPFGCHICGAQFTQSSSRTAHIKAQHKGEHMHRCTDCGKTYKNIGFLRRHVETIHKGPDPGPSVTIVL